MSSPEKRLAELGLSLPPAPQPLGSYTPAVTTGNLVFISGMLPLVEGKLPLAGKVGAEVGAEVAVGLARQAALNALAALRAHLGSLDRVRRCVKVTGYVASAPGFAGQPMVINGASDLMAEVFGAAGVHARAAVGVSELPLGSPVEVEFIFEAG